LAGWTGWFVWLDIWLGVWMISDFLACWLAG